MQVFGFFHYKSLWKVLGTLTQNRDTAWLENTFKKLEMFTPLLYYTLFQNILRVWTKNASFLFFHYKSHWEVWGSLSLDRETAWFENTFQRLLFTPLLYYTSFQNILLVWTNMQIFAFFHYKSHWKVLDSLTQDRETAWFLNTLQRVGNVHTFIKLYFVSKYFACLNQYVRFHVFPL